MIRALLYNRETGTLEDLDRDRVLASMPTEEEAVLARESRPKHRAFQKTHTACRAGELIWIDVRDPRQDDYDMLERRFALHPMVMEDIQGKEGRPKIHDYGEYLYIVFHALGYCSEAASGRLLQDGEGSRGTAEADETHEDGERRGVRRVANRIEDEFGSKGDGEKAAGRESRWNRAIRRTKGGAAKTSLVSRAERPGRFELHITEIDMLVGADYVVTIHHGEVEPFKDLYHRWKRRPQLMKNGAGHLLYEIMDEVLDDYFPLLDALDERIDDFEDRLFRDFEETLSADIFALKRCLLQIRRIAGPMRDVVNILLRHDADAGGRHFAYFQDLYDHATRIVDSVDSFRELLAGALDAYLSIASNRMNAIMKTLTSASIILLIPTLIAGIYGMNFDNMPELHNPNGYHYTIMGMGSIIVGLTFFFWRKKWL